MLLFLKELFSILLYTAGIFILLVTIIAIIETRIEQKQRKQAKKELMDKID